jgi:hypothetical protein
MTTTDPDVAPPDDSTVIDGRSAFQQAVLGALDEAAAAGIQQLWLCDPDFASWPLDQPATLDALGRWANSRRRLTLLANDYRLMPQRYPRWLQWRRQWSHIVQCLAVHPEEAASVPALVYLPDRLAVRLYDLERHRGRIDRAAPDLSRCRELLDALTQRAEESFPVTTLGL